MPCREVEQDLNVHTTHPSTSIPPSVRPCRYAAGKNHSSSIDIQGAKNLVVVRAEFLFDNKFLEHFWHRPIPLLLSSTHRRNEFQQCPFLNEQCIFSAFFPSLKKICSGKLIAFPKGALNSQTLLQIFVPSIFAMIRTIARIQSFLKRMLSH